MTDCHVARRTVAILAVLPLLAAFFPKGAYAATDSAFYPGLFPAMTAGYATTLQQNVDQGRQPWLLKPVQVGLAFSRFVHWGHNPQQARVVTRSGGAMVVAVADRQAPSLTLYVRETQLGHTRRQGIWSVTGCYMNDLSITTPQQGTRIVSPARVRGLVRVFEGQFTLAVLDRQWKPLGTKYIAGAANYQKPGPFFATVLFRPQGTYAVLKAYSLSAKDGSVALLSMVKVSL